MIRLATLADAQAIAQVHVASWKETYSGIVPQSYLDTLDVDARHAQWKAGMAKGTLVWVFETEGRILGFANGGISREKDRLDYPGELYAIYLLAAHQRRGIGRALFACVRQQLEESKLLPFTVWVLAENPACAFYVKSGGKVIDEKPIRIGEVSLRELQYGFM